METLPPDFHVMAGVHSSQETGSNTHGTSTGATFVDPSRPTFLDRGEELLRPKRHHYVTVLHATPRALLVFCSTHLSVNSTTRHPSVSLLLEARILFSVGTKNVTPVSLSIGYVPI